MCWYQYNHNCCIVVIDNASFHLSFYFVTRMHSSRMRTGRSLTVCWSLLSGGVLVRGGLLPEGSGLGGVCSQGGSGPGRVSASGRVWSHGGVWSRGVWSQGGLVPGDLVMGVISQHALRQTPPVDRHTPVKILPWPNFVAAGNKTSFSDIIVIITQFIVNTFFSMLILSFQCTRIFPQIHHRFIIPIIFSFPW